MQINYHLHLSLLENRQVGIWFVLMEMESFIFGIMKANMSKEEIGKLYDWLKKNIKKMTHKSRETSRELARRLKKEKTDNSPHSGVGE